MIICTPDDVCIRNAERAVFTLDGKHLPRPWVIVNRLNSELIRGGEMYSAEVVAQTLDLPLLGEIPEDPVIYRALITHMSLMDADCEGQRALSRIARRMAGGSIPFPAYGVKPLPWYRRLTHRRLKEVKRLDR